MKLRKKAMAMHSKQLLLVLLAVLLTAETKAQPMSKPKCRTECGSVNITFPFGMSKECSLDTSFLITCKRTSSSSYTPFLKNDDDMRVINITLDGELHISLPAANECYNNRSGEYESGNSWMFDVSPFHLSPMQNKLTVVGVDTAGFMTPFDVSSSEGNNYTGSVCLSLYDSDLVKDGSCSGIGCCETPIRQGLSSFYYSTSTNIINNTYYDTLLGSHPCGYAFLVKDGAYNFASKHLHNLTTNSTFPVVLDWAVGNHTCEHAKNQKHLSNYACKSNNSECRNSKLTAGYLCHCSPGYWGNPYLPYGCRDVDECSGPNDCMKGTRCRNTQGSYNCLCPKGYEGDGKK